MIRKIILDELSSCFSDLFCTQLGSKVTEGTLPCLKMLAQVSKGKLDFEKTELKDFQKSVEDVCLISAVLPDGQNLREALQSVATIVRIICLCNGPDANIQENKYKFVKEACAHKSDLLENTHKYIAYLVDFTKYNEKCDEGLDVKPDTVCEVVKEMVRASESLLDGFRATFKGKLDGLIIDVTIPPQVEQITQLEEITDTFLKSSFDMAATQAISEKTVGMSTTLRDLKNACNLMGMQPQNFIDVSGYEVNHRACLTYLRLGLVVVHQMV